jgi:hypothetical protein
VRSIERQQAGIAFANRPQHEAARFAAMLRFADPNLRLADHRAVDHAADGDFNGEAGEYSCGIFAPSTLRLGGFHELAM